jgi:hypothetical protein
MTEVSWREALIIVGALCAVLGVILREAHNDVRGLGLAMVVVGCALFVAGPVGSLFGWW